MAIPLMLLGPGGDYVTRFAVKGRSVVREPAAALGHQPDADAGASTPRRQRRSRGRRSRAATPSGAGGLSSAPAAEAGGVGETGADRFAPSPVTAATMSDARGRPHGGGVGMTGPALVAALAAWLAEQRRALEGLRLGDTGERAGDVGASLAGVVRVRHGGHAPRRTDSRRADALVPAAGASASTASTDNHLTEARHGPQPHPATASHPHPHPRYSGGARLFADDAGARQRARRQQSHRLRARRGAHPKRGAHPRSQQSTLFAG